MNYEARMRGALAAAHEEVNTATDLLEQLVALVHGAKLLEASPPLAALAKRAREWTTAEVREGARRRRYELMHEADRRESV